MFIFMFKYEITNNEVKQNLINQSTDIFYAQAINNYFTFIIYNLIWFNKTYNYKI